jgi:phycocyanobilin:ferredoxin oxidoreductase
MHDSIGRLVELMAAEKYASLSEAERRPKVALDLSQQVELKTYQLLSEMTEPFLLLANLIEITWRCGLDYDLRRQQQQPDFYAYPSVHPFCESDPDLVKESLRMRLENKEYQSSRFRRMHLELSKRNDGLEVLHMVMFPRVRYDLPILCLDMVAFKGRVSFVIVDASPVSRDGKLPQVYLQAMAELRKQHFPTQQQQEQVAAAGKRKGRLPEWAERILSKGVVCMRPQSQDDVTSFIGYCAELLNFHIEAASCFNPLANTAREEEERDFLSEMSEVYQCHERFVKEQRSNDKTSKALEVSFGPSFAEAYMKQTLFDMEPGLKSQPETARLYFGDEVRVNGKSHGVEVASPLARVRSASGNEVYLPQGTWNPGEEIAMLRLLNNRQP